MMGFELQVVNDQWEVVLPDEPVYIHALKMAPEAMESELRSGEWLIVSFSIWGPVRQSVRAAIACAKQYAGKFHLGIRPYDYHEEISKWWPTTDLPVESKTSVTEINEGQRREVHIATDFSTDPAWLVLKDGQVVYRGTGARSAEQLGEVMQSVLQ